MARKTRNAAKILDRLDKGDRELRAMVDEELLNLEVAQLIYDARTAAALTQTRLAEMVGTSQSVIARLEDSDYDGHSLSMLRRIADALGQRIELRFLPKDGGQEAA